MDEIDNTLLDILQKEFPLCSTPFAAIGERLGVSEQHVFDRIAQLKQGRVIRQISPIFDSSKIGYVSTLAAFKVDPSQIDTVADVLNQHDGVSHNYLRDGEFNLWFTLTMPDDVNLEGEIIRLASETAVAEYLYLPTIKTFRIGFTLDFTKRDYDRAGGSNRSVQASPVDPVDKKFVQILQNDMQLITHPYAQAAAQLGISEDRVISKLQQYIKDRRIRRIAAVLRPVHAGFGANTLAAWITGSPDQIESLGNYAASLPAVSHCYQRPSSDRWPYSIYTMIHGHTMDECDMVITDISQKTGISQFCKLVTLKEFKKVRVQYFKNAGDA